MMNNHQPLNLLTNAGQSSAPTSTITSSSSTSDQSQSTSSDSRRQLALATIFNSLSSLASQASSSNNPQNDETSDPSLTLQSVMAAAMLRQQQQQQLLQDEQINPTSNQNPLNQIHHQKPTSTINFLNPLDQSSLYKNVDSFFINQQNHQQQQQQRINYCTICNKELCNKYFMKTHMIKMHGINLEMESNDDGFDGDDSTKRDHSTDDDDDINNDEDHCNGQESSTKDDLNDQAKNPDQNDVKPISFQNDSPWQTDPKQPNKSPNKPANNLKKANQKQYSNPTPKKKQTSLSGSSSNKQTTSVLNGFAGNSMGGVVCDICNKELCSKYFLKVHKQNTHGIADYPDSTTQFAMYPFPTPAMTAPNPFLAVAAAANQPPISQSFTPFPPISQMNIFSPQSSSQASKPTDNHPLNEIAMKKFNKRPRFSEPSKSQLPHSSTIEGNRQDECLMTNSESANKQQMDTVYRLLMAQQQPQLMPQFPIASASGAPLMPPIDPMAASALSIANPLNALMCFGAVGPLGPFGPAGMSPATIVDNILRNQHLFNRVNTNQQSNVAPRGPDDNNNSETNPAKHSKDSSNSRYYSHYTEACPMCDRRFKSIKWLKTHMMNDHKQEIGAYMQMMMQYLYTSKSQQMAATMAVFEQQQQQQHQLNATQQNFIRHLGDQNNQNHDPILSQASNLSNKFQNIDSFQMNYHQQNLSNFSFKPEEAYQYNTRDNSPETQNLKMFSDNRTRNDSVSPDRSNVGQLSASDSTIPQAHSQKRRTSGPSTSLPGNSKQLRINDSLALPEINHNHTNVSAEDLGTDSDTRQDVNDD